MFLADRMDLIERGISPIELADALYDAVQLPAWPEPRLWEAADTYWPAGSWQPTAPDWLMEAVEAHHGRFTF